MFHSSICGSKCFSFCIRHMATSTECVCGQCGARCLVLHAYVDSADVLYCSRECRHAAGDRSGCYGWDCGCTRYAKKRRLLRDHRTNMRVMDNLLVDNDLEDELQERIDEETGNTNFWLGQDSDMDEASDAEDPEKTLREEVMKLRAEAADRSALIQAVQERLGLSNCD